MKLPIKTLQVMDEVYENCEEHLEMLPSLTDRLIFMGRVLATLVSKERDSVEYLSKRLEVLEKRVDACCSKHN